MLSYAQKLALIADDSVAKTLIGRRRGIEKESLRIESKSGHLALTPHPHALGSALTNSQITTDYSEALLEFITTPHRSISSALSQLDSIHRFVYSHLKDEQLWVSSMPCIIARDDAIPVAQYGRSHVAKMKTAYRVGLGHRYGRAMQTIAGIHFNFSFADDFFVALQAKLGDKQSLQDFKTERYFSMIRNFNRNSWLLIYLFGASPAVCNSFLQGRDHQLSQLGRGTLYGEYATALRMGNLGYTSSSQDSLFVCYNQLPTYIQTVHRALTTAYPDFETIGIKDNKGDYKQLSTNILQIENEYYSPIRPKRTAFSGETPIKALHDRGVEYIEVRCLDLNPFLPLGTDEQTLTVVELFLIDCFLQDDIALDEAGLNEANANFKTVVNEGRKPNVQLQQNGEAISLQNWGNHLIGRMQETAKLLEANGETGLVEALSREAEKLQSPELTPSGKIIDSLLENDDSFYGFSMSRSLAAKRFFTEQAISGQSMQGLTEEAERSHVAQAEIEANDTGSFEQYLQEYYQQYDELHHEA